MRDLSAFLLLGTIGCAPAALEPRAGSRAGSVLVADVGDGSILRIDTLSGDVVDVVVDADRIDPDAAPRGFAPSALGWLGDELLVTNFVSGELLRLSPDDGRWLGTLHQNAPEGVRLEEPAAMVVQDGRAAILGNDTRNLLLVDPTAETAELGGDSMPTIRDGHALAPLSDGRLAIGTGPSGEGGLLQLWDPTAGRRDAVLLDDGVVTELTGLALGPDGLLYAVDWWQHALFAIDPLSGQVVDQVLDASTLDSPVALAFDGDVLYVLQRHDVVAWHPATGARTLAADQIDFGRGLLLDP